MYDALNRLVDRSSPTQHDGFVYDVSTSGNFTGTNEVGRLIEQSNYVNASTQYSYDAMGRVIYQGNTLPNGCCDQTANPVHATYDLAGDITSLTYPDGRTATQTYDGAGRLSTVGDGHNTQGYLQSTAYNPDGSPSQLTLGNGIVQSWQQNNRLQVSGLTVADGITNATYLSHSYCYSTADCPSGGTANNGNIWQITDNQVPGRTQSFTYDSLNRISSFALGGVPTQQYAIDSFGNMTRIFNGQPTNTFDPATNRINNLPCAASTQPYDAAGNQLCDTDPDLWIRQYTYNAENQITSIGTPKQPPYEAYTYGADGARVRKNDTLGTFTEYLNFNGQPIAEKDETGAWTDYIFAGGKRIARVAGATPQIHIHGNDCSGCNASWVNSFFSSPIAGYQIATGDRLLLSQRQSNVHAGFQLNTQEGSSTWPNVYDDAGNLLNDSSQADGVWVSRSVNLNPFVNQHIANVAATLTVSPPPNTRWDVYYRDIVIVSQDGSIHPIYTAGMAPGFTQSGAMGESELSARVDNGVAAPVQQVTVRFTNDTCSACLGQPPFQDRNLQVDSIAIGGTTIPSSDPSVSFAGGYYLPPGLMATNGDLTFTLASPLTGPVSVQAWGTPDTGVYPHMQVLVNGALVSEYDVTASPQAYTAALTPTDPSVTTTFYLADHLGSAQMEFSSNGTPLSSSQFFPFGGELNPVPTTNHYKFTGKERDTESGLDYFGARYYASSMGRFMSPDMVDPDLRNPQSLNMYRYAFNNPLRYYDPDGLYERDVHYDLTKALAYAAGYSDSQSRTIAGADQGVDDNPLTSPMHILGGTQARRLFHFTTAARRDELRNAIDGSEERLGVYLHPEQDSFSHAGFGPRIGHALHGHSPDKTYLNPIKADDMASDTYGALQDAGLAGEAGAVPYSSIQTYVQGFNRARTAEDKFRQLDLLRLMVDQYRRDADRSPDNGPGAVPAAVPGPGPGPRP